MGRLLHWQPSLSEKHCTYHPTLCHERHYWLRGLLPTGVLPIPNLIPNETPKNHLSTGHTRCHHRCRWEPLRSIPIGETRRHTTGFLLPPYTNDFRGTICPVKGVVTQATTQSRRIRQPCSQRPVWHILDTLLLAVRYRLGACQKSLQLCNIVTLDWNLYFHNQPIFHKTNPADSHFTKSGRMTNRFQPVLTDSYQFLPHSTGYSLVFQ